MKTQCPQGSTERYWSLKEGWFRCSRCRKTFTDPRKLIWVSGSVLSKVIQEFLLEHSTNKTLTRANISKHMLLEKLTLLRMVMTQDVPEIFEGTIEVDQMYLGG